jgi:hypothetical protein
MKTQKTNNLIIISDLHGGCKFGMCPKNGITLVGGGKYMPNRFQLLLYQYWEEFWNEWVPDVTKGEGYSIVVNGDVVDNRHHNSITQFSHDLNDHKNTAIEILEPIRHNKKVNKFLMTAGTEVHDGQSAEIARMIADCLKADKYDGDEVPQMIFIDVGRWNVNIAHHIGTTSRQAYESSGPMGEITEVWANQMRWGEKRSDVVVRSHRHRYISVGIPTNTITGLSIVTPGWQMKTPFVSRTAGKNHNPQFGGILLRQGDEEPFERHYVRSLKQAKSICS